MDLDDAKPVRCFICGKEQSERRSIEYNDHWFCGLTCKLKQERKDDENLTRLDCAADVVNLGKRKPLP